jgi:hypothetical protein
MEIQRIIITEKERKLVSDFISEDIGLQIDFNKLMSVVEKINKTLEPLTVSLQVTTAGVFLTKIHNAICEVDIKLAHSEIVSAIKWYNDNAVSVGCR